MSLVTCFPIPAQACLWFGPKLGNLWGQKGGQVGSNSVFGLSWKLGVQTSQIFKSQYFSKKYIYKKNSIFISIFY